MCQYMEKRKKELIIRMILIIIIILLLINNYKLIKTFKNKNTKTPTGNVDIFEIYCDEETCGKKEKKESNSTNNEEKITIKTNEIVDVNSKKEIITNNDNTTIENKTNDNTTKNTDDDNTTTGNYITTGNDTTGDDGNTDNDGSSMQNNEGFFVSSKLIRWNSTNELRIFNNPVYNMAPKIAPGDSNIYQFVVSNNTPYNVRYSIKFREENDNNLNIKYRLRKGNSYIAGINGYIDYNELDQNEINLNIGEKDTYYLEWKWLGTDNDNDVAGIQAAYSISIEIEAESINE